jgi:hypothetical protein
MSFVPCDLSGLNCSTPGFTPGSLSVLLPIPGPPQSHSIALVQTDLLIVSMRTSFTISLHLTLSPLIALLRRGAEHRAYAAPPPRSGKQVSPPRVIFESRVLVGQFRR